MDFITNIIKLKPERINEYIILHKHVFPDVLDRIAASNIRNYSIFLHDDLLFSFYEYHGEDHDADMAAMAGDQSTREWWTLTEPMQSPLPGRKNGGWWTETGKVFQRINDTVVNEPLDIKRYAFVGMGRKRDEEKGREGDGGKYRGIRNSELGTRHHCHPGRSRGAALILGIRQLHLSIHNDRVFLYIEAFEDVEENKLNELKSLVSDQLPGSGTPEWIAMKPVFHTDMPKTKKVFVTGCFDMLHSGHIAFIEEASRHGELYVSIGSDENVQQLKGRYPVNNQEERMYMLKSLKYVKECLLNTGFGIMDFTEELKKVQPDIFIVNEDGNTPAKAAFCHEHGIEYKVLKRIPHANLPRRSTTGLRQECSIPYRIDIAGGWLDQPWVSKHHPGPVITVSVEPTIEFNYRSGMATSTRRKAIEIWKTAIPAGDREQLAKLLFTYENPPGTKEVAGSQDALGIVMPGVNKLNYAGEYWPHAIDSNHDEDILQWLEGVLCLVPLGPRVQDYNVLDNTSINAQGAKALSVAAEACWEAIMDKDTGALGTYMRASFEAQAAMFPNMVDETILAGIAAYRDRVSGWKLSGAGGGGYLILVADKPLEGAVKIRIKRKANLY
ncbi:MAG: L-rhamnose mutarotase [Bacteroidales bacterium]|nr:L-rhamnose mutarotase [Bacteroidales bacterium]